MFCTSWVTDIDEFVVAELSSGLFEDLLQPTARPAMPKTKANKCCFFMIIFDCCFFIRLFDSVSAAMFAANFQECFRPEPLLRPPPVTLLTVAQARRPDSPAFR